MTKAQLVLIILITPFFLFAQKTKKVIVIGIDGCRPDALEIANTPILNQLISNGLYSPHAMNEDITISGPGWSSILCGVWSDKHLVTNNNFDVDDYETYPTFFKYIEDYAEELHTVSICHWSPINEFIVKDQADLILNTTSDAEVSSIAASYLEQNDPDVMFLHYDDGDLAGHSFGFSPNVTEYISAIENIDGHIGTVIDAIQQRTSYDQEDWLILVTTDHGGRGFSHGGNSLEEKTVFVIASGNSIPSSHVSKDIIVSIDTIPNCLGSSANLAFDGDDDFVEIPSDSIFDFGSDQDFTIECRVRTQLAADVGILGNKDWDSGGNKGIVFSFKFPSGPEWKVNIGDGNNRVDIDTGNEIADNEWHTLSVSFDRDGYMKMYNDGLLQDSADISMIGDINTGEGLFLGTDINSAYDFSGRIAEVRVWNGVLSNQDINQWHCTTLDNSHSQYANLAGYWKMDEGLGSNLIFDSSPNGNDGIIASGNWIASDTILMDDFSNTPRLTDILPSVLKHLCIPLPMPWSLEGTSLVAECTTSSLDLKGTNLSPIKLYPNPSMGHIYLTGEGIEGVMIRNESGSIISIQKALKMSTDKFKVDTSALRPGVYFLSVNTKEGRSQHKFIIAH